MRTNRRMSTTASQLVDKGYAPIWYNNNSGVMMACHLQWTDEDDEVMAKAADDWNAGKPMTSFITNGKRIVTSPSTIDLDYPRPNNKPGWIIAIAKPLSNVPERSQL